MDLEDDKTSLKETGIERRHFSKNEESKSREKT